MRAKSLSCRTLFRRASQYFNIQCYAVDALIFYNKWDHGQPLIALRNMFQCWCLNQYLLLFLFFFLE